MTFSQGWDAGFKAVLIFIGVVLSWLGLVEPLIGNQQVSEPLMFVVATALAAGFFLWVRGRCRRERAQTEADWRAAGESEQ
ncbi:MAG: hypothetical protein ABIQ30_02865 [Devosia sp.]